MVIWISRATYTLNICRRICNPAHLVEWLKKMLVFGLTVSRPSRHSMIMKVATGVAKAETR